LLLKTGNHLSHIPFPHPPSPVDCCFSFWLAIDHKICSSFATSDRHTNSHADFISASLFTHWYSLTRANACHQKDVPDHLLLLWVAGDLLFWWQAFSLVNKCECVKMRSYNRRTWQPRIPLLLLTSATRESLFRTPSTSNPPRVHPYIYMSPPTHDHALFCWWGMLGD
jgi:hypothetical protein